MDNFAKQTFMIFFQLFRGVQRQNKLKREEQKIILQSLLNNSKADQFPHQVEKIYLNYGCST